MRVDLRSRHNPYLMALFALSRDIAKSGDWQQIIKHRNVVTHRFLVLHGMQLSDQPNADIPRMQEDEFLAETIMVMKIARAAVMYLILLVEYEERRAASLNEGLKAPIYAVPLGEDFRHRPWF